MRTLWARRCSRCRTVDTSQLWDDPTQAHATVNPKRWYMRTQPAWTCSACGFHKYTVERAEDQPNLQ
jgi:Zn ribbon nucleic-acid-binding protein